MMSLQRLSAGLRSVMLASRIPYQGSTYSMSTLADQFQTAKEQLNTMKEDPGSDAKLKLYGLFKQATEGSVTTSRPGMTNFVARAKYDAWKANDSLSKDEAQQAYVDFVKSLTKAEESTGETQQASGQKYKNFLVEMDGGLRKITLNRPKKMNAITQEMYLEWIAALEEAGDDPATVVTALTGAGDYYCSGNDLSNFMGIPPNEEAAYSAKMCVLLKKFVGTFIDFKKPLIAVINGPAIGISVTTLGLADIVYASDRATFTTPFSRLGQGPEGCATYTYPKMMGLAKSSELLMFDKKITAKEACDVNLVTEVFPHESLEAEVWPRIKKYSQLPAKSLFYTKESVRSQFRKDLHKANDVECERLEERFISDDCKNAIMNFMSRKK